MCGKFKQDLDLAALAALLRLPLHTDGWQGHTVTPGRIGMAVTGSADQATVQRMRFGFATTAGLGVRPVINARAETMAQKPLFRLPFTSQRCLIPVSAFFEGRQIFATPASLVFCLAGLWQQGADGMAECVVITRQATAPVSPAHDRMAMALTDTASCRDWLLAAKTPANAPELQEQQETPPATDRQMALF